MVDEVEPEWYDPAPFGRYPRADMGFVVFAQQGYFVVAINPTGSTGFGQGICSLGFTLNLWVLDTVRLPDLTDAIAKDWGGKPFVDLRKGWQYILDNYPQVETPTFPSSAVYLSGSYRSIRTVPSPLVPAMEDTPSSASLRRFLTTTAKAAPSWIQSNPEFGFGFKALICHDGVCGGDLRLTRN